MSHHDVAKMFDALNVLRQATENEELQVASAQLLLAIAQRSETPMADLEAAVGISQAAISRNVAKMGAGLTLQDRGPGLVESFEDPAFRRRKLVRLTPRGKEVIKRLLSVLTA